MFAPQSHFFIDYYDNHYAHFICLLLLEPQVKKKFWVVSKSVMDYQFWQSVILRIVILVWMFITKMNFTRFVVNFEYSYSLRLTSPFPLLHFQEHFNSSQLCFTWRPSIWFLFTHFITISGHFLSSLNEEKLKQSPLLTWTVTQNVRAFWATDEGFFNTGSP